MTEQYDVIIIGGGMVGLTLSCLLAQNDIKVALIEAQQPEDLDASAAYELRVSAISKSTQQVLKKIGAWQGMLNRRACAYQHMHVWDATGEGSIHFDAAEMGLDSIGHIIENRIIQFSLYEQCVKLASLSLFCPQQLSEIKISDSGSEVCLADGTHLSARLLTGADGANSNVRDAANISVNQSEYKQKAIVAVVKSSLHHKDTAWQRFLPSGPLAFLPLGDGSCSIVWSADNDRADELLAMSETEFIRQLENAFDGTLGRVEKISQLAAFPLVRRHAEEYVKAGVALVGDAAHTIHPLAGQGVNLGVLDAAALAQVLVNARNTGKDIASFSTLRKYERWRRADNSIMMYSMSGFKNLFSNNQSSLSLIRNAGLNCVDKLSFVKQKVMRQALGLEGDLPEVARSTGW
ncbi:MAG TPA: 2-octaprenyl-3-methyl-6-methoxy-1,4-benzoquinol hydroxylase [Gammaproteobacteria bacterium]|nr:2-octaprenyl-3-methyl-6-methoxy-1,4-benzoquinol hydroxylase [Gammaproteobacteria bacterium]